MITEMVARAALSLILFVSFLAGCATPPQRRPMQPVALIPAEIAAEFQESVAAWNGGNFGRFLAIYAENATFALAEEYLYGRESIGEFYASNFEPGVERGLLSFDQLDVEILSPEVVLVRAIYRNSYDSDTIRIGASTLILRRLFGRWQIIHDHSN